MEILRHHDVTHPGEITWSQLGGSMEILRHHDVTHPGRYANLPKQTFRFNSPTQDS